jgi:hypothetical protein
MHVLELKVPPVALVFLVAALMWLVSWAMSALGFEFPSGNVLAASVAVAGAIISGLGIVSFRQARTTVNPMKPDSTSSLVVSGIYRLTRNPMYLGFLLVLLGWAIFLSNRRKRRFTLYSGPRSSRIPRGCVDGYEHGTSLNTDLYRQHVGSPPWWCNVRRQHTEERIWNIL